MLVTTCIDINTMNHVAKLGAWETYSTGEKTWSNC